MKKLLRKLAFCVEVCLLIIQLLVRYFVVTLLKWMVVWRVIFFLHVSFDAFGFGWIALLICKAVKGV